MVLWSCLLQFLPLLQAHLTYSTHLTHLVGSTFVLDLIPISDPLILSVRKRSSKRPDKQKPAYPRYAFEVENSTGVKNGLIRLLRIPARFQTNLYVIGPGEEEAKLFRRYIRETPFGEHASRFQFHFYNEVQKFYETGVAFDASRKAWCVQTA